MTARPDTSESLAAEHRVMRLEAVLCVPGAYVAHTDGTHWTLVSDQHSPRFKPAMFRTPREARAAIVTAELATADLLARVFS